METVEDFPEGRWEFEEVMEGREEGIGGERGALRSIRGCQKPRLISDLWWAGPESLIKGSRHIQDGASVMNFLLTQ